MANNLPLCCPAAVDCEGFKLGDKAEGKLTLIQLSIRPGSGKQLRVWLVDVLKLQGEALLCSTPDKAVSAVRIRA